MASEITAFPGSRSSSRALQYRFPLVHADSIGFLLVALLGAILHAIAYASLAPIFVGLVFALAGLGALMLGGSRWSLERQGFMRTFTLCWFWASIAAVSANLFDDPVQSSFDAANFFRLATRDAGGLAIDEIRLFAEGGAAIVFWRTVYDVFAMAGFVKEPYIGISANVLLVSMTCAVAVRVVRHVFGDDPYRIRRMILLWSLCGMFWLFAAIHIRDAAVLFAVTLLTLIWIRYLRAYRVFDLMVLIGASLLAAAMMGYLRTEFALVPVAMLFAATAATTMGGSIGQSRLLWVAASIVTVAVLILALVQFQDELTTILTLGNVAYRDFAMQNAESSSLGANLVVDAPLPVRIFLGSAYLYVFPIPVWAGFQLESAYHLLKSLHAIFVYFTFPLVVLGAWVTLREQSSARPQLLFMLILLAGFTVVVAATSLETRHLGAFLMPYLMLAVVPRIEDRRTRKNYLVLMLPFMLLIVVGHVSWALIKLS